MNNFCTQFQMSLTQYTNLVNDLAKYRTYIKQIEKREHYTNPDIIEYTVGKNGDGNDNGIGSDVSDYYDLPMNMVILGFSYQGMRPGHMYSMKVLNEPIVGEVVLFHNSSIKNTTIQPICRNKDAFLRHFTYKEIVLCLSGINPPCVIFYCCADRTLTPEYPLTFDQRLDVHTGTHLVLVGRCLSKHCTTPKEHKKCYHTH